LLSTSEETMICHNLFGLWNALYSPSKDTCALYPGFRFIAFHPLMLFFFFFSLSFFFFFFFFFFLPLFLLPLFVDFY